MTSLLGGSYGVMMLSRVGAARRYVDGHEGVKARHLLGDACRG